MNLTTGMTLGHYEIIDTLGAGGMGEVYRARDKRLGREVAIKVLPTRLASDQQALARFEREAKSLAALSHPNILTIHDFATENGIAYAVMELLEGESLRSRIARTPLQWSRVVEIGLAIAEGLAAAHSRGIIHRDLKPENIFLTSHGGIKILDFGLARMDRIPGADSKSVLPTVAADTEPGTVLGTLGYMAPEQLRGQNVDARSDIFSFGCVLYEMLTGVSPFRRNTAADTMAAVLNSEPPQLSQSGQVIPPEMDRVVMHCLEKDPEQRFHSARDLAFDLKEIASGSRIYGPQSAGLVAAQQKPSVNRWILPAIVLLVLLAGGLWFFRARFSPPSDNGQKIPIAVADFVNETGEKDMDGLSGMLITSLEQSRKLSVLTRTRMFDVLKQIGKENVDRIDENIGREICRQANVSGLVLASIRKFDQLYTIDLKILDPQKNEYIFTTKEEGNGKSSVPSMIDKLSEATRSGLNEKAAEIQANTKKVAEVTTDNLEAYQHFFQGQQYINQLKFPEAEGEFNEAIKLDPEFSLAYFWRAYAVSWVSTTRGLQSSEETFKHAGKLPEKERAFTEAFRAFALGHDPKKAIGIIRKLLERYPEEKEAYFLIGDWSYHSGDYQTAIEYFKKVLALDPTSERSYQHLCWSYQASRKRAELVQTAKDYVTKINSATAYGLLANAYLAANDFKQAFATNDQWLQRYPASIEPTLQKIELYAKTGQPDNAEKAMSDLLATSHDTKNFKEISQNLSWGYAYLGRFHEAKRSHEEAISIVKQSDQDEHLLSVLYGQLVYFCVVLNDQACANDAYAQTKRYAVAEPTRDSMEAAISIGDFAEASKEAVKEISAHAPYTAETIAGYKQHQQGEFAKAAENWSVVVEKGLALDRDLRGFDLAALYLEMGETDKALSMVKEILSPSMTSFDLIPRLLFLQGKIYEKKGDRVRAIESYRKLLEVWKHADKDLPDFVDAKARLAKLS